MIHVPGAGPLNAKLLFVGEGPGRNEEIKGRPFVGMTGQFVRGIVERAGLDPEDVRWNNVIPTRQKPTPAVLKEHWGNIAEDMDLCTAKVILACGGVAVQRMLSISGIKEKHGGVYQKDGRLIIPCLHPAAVMKGKIQAERMSCDRAITRAVRYATGEIKYNPVMPIVIENPSPTSVNQVLNGQSVVVVDTEFDPDKRTTFCVGFTVDGKTVYSIGAVDNEMHEVLAKHFSRKDLRKVAHYHFADVKALSWLGVDSVAPWFDTLTVFASLYPDLPCGLSHVARFYLDDVADWKHMDKDDPLYNAMDVAYTWRIYQAECVDLSDAGMWELYEQEIEPTLPLLYGMEERGLLVDREALRTMRQEATKEIGTLRKELAASVGVLFDKRRAPLVDIIEENTYHLIIAEAIDPDVVCEVHPKYNGLRGKKFTTKNDKCKCKIIHENVSMAERRTSIAALRLEITKAKGKLKRWERGFDPDNNDHVRWLLYDKAGLGLRTQKNRTTGRATADATAIAKLLSLKTTQRKQGAVDILRAIKRIQKLEKRLSTFLFQSKAGRRAIDRNNCVHPQYRMRAGTGRPASGSDPYLDEKGVSENRFNVLNIPEAVRKIYIPHG